MTFQEFMNNIIIPGAINIALRLLLAGILLLVGSLIIKFVVKKLKHGKFSTRVDKTVHHFTVSFVKIALYVILAIIVVATLGVEMSSIIAVIGSVGLAISLAVQGTLSNLASGIMILVFKPFREGDYIETSGEGGTVTEVGIFYTTLCTPDNKIVVVPNGGVTSSVLRNYSTKETRRVDVALTLAHGTSLETVQQVVREVVDTHELILKDPAPFVRLTGLDGGSITVTVRAWVKNENFWDVNFHLLETIYARLGEAGVSVPHTQVDLHLKQK